MAAHVSSQALRRCATNRDGLLHLDDEGPDVKDSKPHWFIDSSVFSGSVMFMVCLNAIQIGAEADFPDFWAWAPLEHFFTAAFLAEALAKIAVLGKEYFRHSFNCVDFFLVAMGVLDSWALALLFTRADLQSLTALRLVRIVRVARVFKVARRNKQVMLVVTGIAKAMQSAIWVTLVLVITIYVAAIFCVQTLGGESMKDFPGYTQDAEEINQTDVMMEFNPHVRFGCMRNAMMTLFNIAIQAEFSDILWPLLLRRPIFVPFLLLFTVMVTYGMMNLVVGLVVEHVIGDAHAFDQEHGQHQAQIQKDALGNITKVLRTIASHSSTGHLTADAIAEINAADMKLLRKLIHAMGLPSNFTPVHLLELLDENGNGKIDDDELSEATAQLVEAMDANPFQHMSVLLRSVHCLRAQMLQQQTNMEQAIQRGFEDLAARLCKMTSEPKLRNQKTTSEPKTGCQVCKVPPHEQQSSFADPVIHSDKSLEQAQDKLQAAIAVVEMARDTMNQPKVQKPCDFRASGESVLEKALAPASPSLLVRHAVSNEIQLSSGNSQFTCSTSYQALMEGELPGYQATRLQASFFTRPGRALEALEGECGHHHMKGSASMKEEPGAADEAIGCDKVAL